jgi:two-component system sensor histidine kinase DesK
VLGFGAIELVMSTPDEDLAYWLPYSMITMFATGLIVYGLTTLSSVVTAMDAARTELAKMAVAQERLRFARDLHDLLGYSLSAISMKTELTHRLVTKNPVRAQEELTQIIEISRQALSDVRSVASGYRELSLDDEAVSARSVLSAADVDVRMEISHHDLPTPVRTVLATVLREGVTNILRHSKAERCDITLRQTDSDVTITITNDGVSHEPQAQLSDGGSGIQNLSNRVANLDGTLSTGTDQDGRFRLRATIPTSRVHSQADA